MAEPGTTSGVQELIDRLSHEGVVEGERRAETIIAEAHRKADDIIEAARVEANEILKQAREEADHFKAGGEEALQLACRDAVRDLGSRLHDGFRNRLQELVRHHLQETKLLKRMILEITRKARPDDKDAELVVLLPPQAIREEEVRKQIQAGNEDALTDFVKDLLGDSARAGFSVKLGAADQTGLRIQVVNENVEIDFTDEAITDLLADHLLPRFRAIMRR